MPTTDIVILTAIISAFIVFGVVLAWGDYQTRQLGRQNIAARDESPLTSAPQTDLQIAAAPSPAMAAAAREMART